MKKNKIMAIVGIIAGIGFLARTILINNLRESKRQEQEKLIESVESVGAAKSIDESSNNSAIIKSIIDNKPKETSDETSIQAKDVEYEEYIPIDGIHSLAKVKGEYYVVEVATQTLSKLDSVTNARICYIKNEDNDTEFNGIFIFKDNTWYLIDENQNILADLGSMEVVEKAKFTIRNSQLILNEQ